MWTVACGQGRDTAIADFAERQRTHGREMAHWYQQHLRQERTQRLEGAFRRKSFQRIGAEWDEDREARVKREQCRQTRVALSIPNCEAICKLRRRRARYRRWRRPTATRPPA